VRSILNGLAMPSTSQKFGTTSIALLNVETRPQCLLASIALLNVETRLQCLRNFVLWIAVRIHTNLRENKCLKILAHREQIEPLQCMELKRSSQQNALKPDAPKDAGFGPSDFFRLSAFGTSCSPHTGFDHFRSRAPAYIASITLTRAAASRGVTSGWSLAPATASTN
jgi:hypothetical protein